MSESLSFAVTPEKVSFKKTLKEEFLEMEIWAISDENPNRKKTHFSISSMKNAIPTMHNKPILGYFDGKEFWAHEGKVSIDQDFNQKFWDTTGGEQILGLIRESDKIRLEKDELDRTWVVITCALWTNYCYKQAKRLLRDSKTQNRKVSVEITVNDYEDREDGVKEITDFTLNGITILGVKRGKKVLEGIPDAHLTLLNTEAREEQLKALTFAYEKYDAEADITTEEFSSEIPSKQDNPNNSTTTIKDDSAERYTQSSNDSGLENKKDNSEENGVGSNNHDALTFNSNNSHDDDSNVNKEVITENLEFSLSQDDKKKEEESNMPEKQNLEQPENVVATTDDQTATNYSSDQGNCSCGDENKCATEDGNCSAEEPKKDENCSCKCEEGSDDGEKKDGEPCGCAAEPADDKCPDCGKAGSECKCAAEKAPDEDELCSLKCKYEALETSYNELTAKYSDYDEIKTRMEKAENELFSIHCENMRVFAVNAMTNERIEENLSKSISEKAAAGQYATTDDILNDVAIAIYKSRPEPSERFSSELPAKEEKTTKEKAKRYSTPAERIAANIGNK